MASDAQLLPFRTRVEMLRDTWRDMRLALDIRTVADWESQQKALGLLHTWASNAVSEANLAYADDIPLTISAAPTESAPSFTVAVGTVSQLVIRATPQAEDRRLWGLKLSLKMADGPTPVAVKPNRSPPHWTRTIIEEIVLALLASYERTRSGSFNRRSRSE